MNNTSRIGVSRASPYSSVSLLTLASLRDISQLNVMMDSRPILPNSFHPQSTETTRDLKHWVAPRSRTTHPVKYYLMDFGLSTRYSAEETNPLEVPIFGGDRTVPEFQQDRTIPRNPFHTDIYYMGNLVRQYFMQVCVNLHCEASSKFLAYTFS